MRSKTKYFIIALLFALIAFTGVGVSKWNIHIQQQFNDPFKAVDHVTADPIIGRYIRIQNAETEDVLPGADLTYNGNPYTVTVTNAGNSGETNASTWTEWQDAGLTFTYSYTGTTAGGANYSSENAPKDAGTYTCKITAVAGTGSDASAKTAAKELNIYTASDGSNYAAEISFVVKQKEGAITGNITSSDKPSAANLSTFAQKVAPLAETTGTTRATDPLSIYFEPTISEADKLSALFVPQKDGNNLPYYDAKYNGATKQLTLDARFETGVVVAADVDTTGIEFEFKDADGKALTDLTNASNDKIYTATAKSTNPNYKVTNYEFRFKIVQRIITVKIATDHTSVYGDPIQDYNYTGSDLASGDDIKDIVSITVKNASGEVVTLSETSNAGTYTMQGAQRNDNQTAKNYSVTTITEGRYEITKRPLKVTIDNATSVYGDPIATLTCKGDNLVNSDDIYDIVSLSTTAKATSNVGSYNIEGVQLTSGVANNYEVTFANNGTYTITKRPITVKIDDKSSIYGNAIETLTCSTNPQDNVAINDGLNNIVSLSTEASATATCGTYPITGMQLTSGVALNYTVTFANGTYAITKRTISLTYDKDTFTYTGNVQHPTVGLNNKANHDTLEKVISVAYNGGTNVGSYKATVTLTDTTNYQWAEGTATEIPFTITPADITATVSPYTGTYNNAEHPIATVNSTTVGGQTATIKYTLDGTEYNSAPNIKDAGSYTFTVTITAPNHNEWTGAYTATIQKIKLVKPTRGSNAQFTFNGEPITYYPDGFDSATMNITGNTQTNRGRHSTVTTLKDPDNYEWSDGTNGSVTIPFTIDYLTFNPTKTEKTFTYNGSNQYNDILTNGVKDGQNNDEYYSKYLNVAVEKGGTTVTECIDAGDYTFVFTLKDSNNTTFFGSDTEVRLTFTISKATIDLNGFTAEWQCSNGTTSSPISNNGTVSHGPTYTVTISNLNTISLPTGITGVDVTTLITVNYTGNTGNSEGDYTANATISPADANNYTVINMPAGGYSLEWKISTIITVTVPSNGNSYTYTGENLYPTIRDQFNGYNTDIMTVNVIDCTNAGEYTFTFALKNTETHQWGATEGATISADGTTASVTVTIDKASFDMSAVKWVMHHDNTQSTVFEVTYDSKEYKVELSGLPTVGNLTATYTDNTATNAGNYTASVSFTYDTENYNAPAAIADQAWKINRAPIAKPTVNLDKNFTYTSADLQNDILNTGFNNFDLSYDPDKITVTKLTRVVNATNYDFTFTLNKNYIWEDGSTSTVTLRITVNKLKIRVLSPLLEYTYAEMTSGVSYTTLEDNVAADTLHKLSSVIGSIKYSIKQSVDGTALASGKAITQGNTYKITYTTANSSNIEFVGNSYCYLKYKTAKIDVTYYTVEDAIAASGTITFAGNSTSETSYVETGFSLLTVNDYSELTNYHADHTYTISGRTLIVPYNDSTTALKGEKGSGSTRNAYSALTIPEGITLNFNNNSKLQVAAHIATTAMQASVWEHGVLMNDGIINIKSGSTLEAYGYIKSSSINSKGIINLEDNSTATEFMYIHDWPGGSAASNIFSKTFPINAWSLHNISCAIRIYNGAKYNAYAAVVATLVNYQSTTACIIGKQGETNCLFTPTTTNASDYILKYAIPAKSWKDSDTNYKNLYSITGSNYTKGQKDIIEINGSYTDGVLNVHVYVDMSTSTSISAPLGYMDVTVKSGSTLTLSSSDYMFLPGTKLVVEGNATVNISNGVDVVFLDTATVEGYGGDRNFVKSYCIDKNNSYAEVSGTLNVEGNIGGRIDCPEPNALLNLSSTAGASYTMMISTADPRTTTGSGYKAKGIVDGTDNTEFTLTAYVSVKGENGCYWTAASGYDNYTIEKHIYDGNVVSNTYYYSGTVPTIGPSTLGTPQRDYYDFDGWYTDSACTIPFEDQTVTNGTTYTVYAKWVEKQYYINYIVFDKNNAVIDPANYTNSSTLQYSASNPLVLTKVTGTNGIESWLFDGFWYLKVLDDYKQLPADVSSRDVPVNPYAENPPEGYDTLLSFLYGSNTTAESAVTLYTWLRELQEFTITYHYYDPVQNIDVTESSSILEGTTNYTLKDLATYNNDPNYKWYYNTTWFRNEACTEPFAEGTAITSNLDLYAKQPSEKTTITVTYDYNGGTDSGGNATTTKDVYAVPNDEYKVSIDADAPTLTNCTFAGWFLMSADNKSGTKISGNYTTANTAFTLVAQWKVEVAVTLENATVTITYSGLIDNSDSTGIEWTENATHTGKFTAYRGGKITNIVATYTQDNSKKLTVNGSNYTSNSNSEYNITANTEVVASSQAGGGSCVARGTLITMADGTQKAIEDLTENDMVLAFNHETGLYEATPIFMVVNHGTADYTVINLKFSDNSILKMIESHGLFDLGLRQYVDITEQNYTEFIGHRFAKYGGGQNTESVTLDSAWLSTERTDMMAVFTYGNLNAITEGLLSYDTKLFGTYNYFTYDENMKYVSEDMARDLALYGEYTYADWSAYLNEDTYNAFNFKYFKVSIAKGLMTEEELIGYIEWLAELVKEGGVPVSKYL